MKTWQTLFLAGAILCSSGVFTGTGTFLMFLGLVVWGFTPLSY